MPDHDYLNPFVLPVKPRAAERHGIIDLYLPDGKTPYEDLPHEDLSAGKLSAGSVPQPRPAIVFVHGGPVPAQLTPTPRGWPVYQAYGALAAARGIVGVTVDHRLHSPIAYPQAADDVAAAVAFARADPRVDGNRVALWFFSGGGPLSADWLRDPPPWLRCVAASYPLLAPFPGWPADPRFLPAEAVTSAGTLPIVLTRVGLENPQVTEGVEAFVQAAHTARTHLDIIDVPNGRHGFDYLDDTDESREAIERAFTRVLTTFETI